MSSNSQIDLGFLEETEPWELHSRFFPSKVGGKPAWLDLKDLPQTSDLQCGCCNEPCIFLCQIYAPIDDNPEAFHRTLFVFICKNGLCCKSNNADNLKVFRCQLKKENPFYPANPPIEDKNEVFDVSKWPPLCYVCGAKGLSHCGKCKSTNYCSRLHQVLHWKNGHKERCDNTTDEVSTETAQNIIMFPEWGLSMDEESEAEAASQVNEEKELKLLQELIDENKAGSLINESESELEQYAQSVEDKVFGKFKKRVNRHPDQVLRYERGGEPIWITSHPVILAIDVPNCQYCNQKRIFECQIMPQLLNSLELDIGVNSIDWGVITIYTCQQNCTSQGSVYKKEYIFKQDIVGKE